MSTAMQGKFRETLDMHIIEAKKAYFDQLVQTLESTPGVTVTSTTFVQYGLGANGRTDVNSFRGCAIVVRNYDGETRTIQLGHDGAQLNVIDGPRIQSTTTLHKLFDAK